MRGRSACCKQKISVQYPLVELFSALLPVLLFYKFPFMDSDGAINIAQWWRFLHAYLFCSALFIGSIIDLQHMIIPDVISLGLVALTPLVVYLHPELDWKSASIGVVGGGALLYVISWGYWLLRRKVGMGMGDVKLLAGIGGWLGYQGILTTVLYASVLGTVVSILLILIKKKGYNLQTAFPFVPFLSLGAVLHLLLGQEVLLNLT